MSWRGRASSRLAIAHIASSLPAVHQARQVCAQHLGSSRLAAIAVLLGAVLYSLSGPGAAVGGGAPGTRASARLTTTFVAPERTQWLRAWCPHARSLLTAWRRS